VLDDTVARNLRVMLSTGVLDPQQRASGAFNVPAHHQAARAIAREAIVLLKNDRGLLPLTGLRRIVVVGDNATVLHGPGGFSSGVCPSYEVDPLTGLKAALGDRVAVTYHPKKRS